MSRKIDVFLTMRDAGFTATLKNSAALLKSFSKEGDAVRRNLDRTGKKITAFGGMLTTAVTAPLVGMAALSVKNFGSVDSTMRLVNATMGNTEEEAAALQKAMGEAASKSVFSMQESADAVLNFARQGWKAKEAADMLAPSLNLAAGTATDLGVVTGGLGNAMKAFGADASEAERYADILATAQSKANTTVTDLFESMANAGPVVKSVGWDIADLATATAVLGDHSITGAEAGNALKSGLLNLASNSKAISMLDKLGVSIFDAEGKMKSMTEVQGALHDAMAGLTQEEKLQAAASLFGKNQASKWLALIDESPGHVKELSDSIGEASTSTRGLADAMMQGIGGSLERLKSTFDVTQNKIGKIVGETLQPFVERIIEILDRFNNLDEAQQRQIVKWGMIAAAAGPVIMLTGKLVSGAAKLFKIFSTVSKAGGLVKAALAAIAAPAGLVIAAIAGIVAVVALIATHFDTLKGKLQEGSDKFDRAREAVRKLHDTASPIIDMLKDIGSHIWDWCGNALASFAGEVILGLVDGFAALCEGIEKTIKLVKDLNIPTLGAFSTSTEADRYPVYGSNGNAYGAVGASYVLEPFHNAAGTSYWRGGLTHINENGGEIIDLPQGTRIYPHERSLNMARGGNVTIPKLADQIIIREDADIERIGEMLVRKLRTASGNMGGEYIGSMA